MPSQRPHLAQWLRSELLLEAGHRCAIPTCRQWPIELAHIVQRSKSEDDGFDNIIVLCTRCHDLYDRYKAMTVKEMRAYKRTLEIFGERTGNIERRLRDLAIWQLLDLYGFDYHPMIKYVRRGEPLPAGCGKSYVFLALWQIHDRHGYKLRVAVGDDSGRSEQPAGQEM